MHCTVKYVVIFLLVSFVEGRGVNGGFSCAGCTIISGIADQLAQIHNETLLAASLRLCQMMPAVAESYCIEAVTTLEPIITNPKLSEIFTPDVFCYGIDICYLDPGQSYCHLFPRPQMGFRQSVQLIKDLLPPEPQRSAINRHLAHISLDLCRFPGIHELCEMFNRSWSLIRPALDVDGDWFSIVRDTVHNYTQPLLDELDWPHLGFATGFMNTTEPLLIKGITDSLYLRLRARNRCNHRDYQNLSRNGASSYDGITYVKSLARNQTHDKPLLVMYGMYGNDICNRFSDALPNMTTPAEFYRNVMNVLNVLNTSLPFGSHVMLIGLVDGGFIYPTMENRIHPLGQLHGNIHYRDVYTWFNCMEMGPCSAWMNGNVTLRKMATMRAQKLTLVLKNIVAKERFATFSLRYLDNPVLSVMWDWKQKGKPLWQLLDPVDSLHPSQTAQPLLAHVLWDNILRNFPEALGDENPNNKKIEQLFGDQGGH
ncbi:acyloxyacyl hydrolase-like isoform X2 [Periplaneta americana]|uniref:acyloxyacyl hydrolase-like isoform X2 n=1 Tax=Periplaneta americana TaxID=6978 RepID=UPI0037E7F9B0